MHFAQGPAILQPRMKEYCCRILHRRFTSRLPPLLLLTVRRQRSQHTRLLYTRSPVLWAQRILCIHNPRYSLDGYSGGSHLACTQTGILGSGRESGQFRKTELGDPDFFFLKTLWKTAKQGCATPDRPKAALRKWGEYG